MKKRTLTENQKYGTATAWLIFGLFIGYVLGYIHPVAFETLPEALPEAFIQTS